MFTIQFSNNRLQVVSTNNLTDPNALFFKSVAEAKSAQQYLSAFMLCPTSLVFKVRWQVECSLHESWLIAKSSERLAKELDNYKRQQIDFFFEELVIRLDRNKIRYVNYRQFELDSDDVLIQTQGAFQYRLLRKINNSTIVIAEYACGHS